MWCKTRKVGQVRVVMCQNGAFFGARLHKKYMALHQKSCSGAFSVQFTRIIASLYGLLDEGVHDCWCVFIKMYTRLFYIRLFFAPIHEYMCTFTDEMHQALKNGAFHRYFLYSVVHFAIIKGTKPVE